MLIILGLLFLPAIIYFTARSAAYDGTLEALKDYDKIEVEEN